LQKPKDYDITGRYLVVLPDETKGLLSFFLNKNDQAGKWEQNEGDPAIVDEGLLEWCNQKISTT